MVGRRQKKNYWRGSGCGCATVSNHIQDKRFWSSALACLWQVRMWKLLVSLQGTRDAAEKWWDVCVSGTFASRVLDHEHTLRVETDDDWRVSERRESMLIPNGRVSSGACGVMYQVNTWYWKRIVQKKIRRQLWESLANMHNARKMIVLIGITANDGTWQESTNGCKGTRLPDWTCGRRTNQICSMW